MENKICGIYKIENKVNGKVYIGLSSDVLKRFKAHKSALNRNGHINKHLLSAYNNYGIDNFSFDIIEECEPTNKELLKELEIKNIKKYKANDNRFGYNLTSGGDGVRDLSYESREKISIGESLDDVVQISNDGKVINIFRNCRVAAEYFNKKSLKENIRNCCDKRYGYKTSLGYYWMYRKEYEEFGFDLNDYALPNNMFNVKPIIQYDKSGKFIAEYKSARECSNITGIGYKLISRVCNGQRQHTNGYVFKFKEFILN